VGVVAAAAEVAGQTLDALAAALDEDEDDNGDTTICVPAGSCATMMRVFWPELFHLAGDEARVERARRVGARTREFSELVHERTGGRLPGDPRYAADVAYHHSCHMLRELHLHDPPEALLGSLDGCRVVTWSAAERCCGFGGLFSVKLPETSVAMADDKLDALGETAATELVGCDQSCLAHLQGRLRRRGNPIPVKHLAQVLDEATSATRSAPATRQRGNPTPEPKGTQA
jgi:L-lactate dehydrogenase complex protein LldE